MGRGCWVSRRGSTLLLALVALGCSGQRAEDVSRSINRADAGLRVDAGEDAEDADLTVPEDADAVSSEDADVASMPEADPVNMLDASAEPVGTDASSSEHPLDGGVVVLPDAGIEQACSLDMTVPSGYIDAVSRADGQWIASSNDAQQGQQLRVFDGTSWGAPQSLSTAPDVSGSPGLSALVVDGTGRTYAVKAQGTQDQAAAPGSLLRRVLAPDAISFGAFEPPIPYAATFSLKAFPSSGALLLFLQFVYEGGRSVERRVQAALFDVASGSWGPSHQLGSSESDMLLGGQDIATNAEGHAAVQISRSGQHERWLLLHDGSTWSEPILHQAAVGALSNAGMALYANGDVLLGWGDDQTSLAQVQRYRVSERAWDPAETLEPFPALPGGPFNRGQYSATLFIDAHDRATLLVRYMPSFTCFGGQTRAYRNLGSGWSAGSVLGADGNSTLAANSKGDLAVLTGSSLDQSSVHHASATSSVWSSRHVTLPMQGGTGCTRVVNLTVDATSDRFVGIFPAADHGILICL